MVYILSGGEANLGVFRPPVALLAASLWPNCVFSLSLSYSQHIPRTSVPPVMS